MRILTLASTKGGVGKSTYTVSLADSFLRHGKSVRLFDLDPQRSTHRWGQAVNQNNPNLETRYVDVDDEGTLNECYNHISAQIEDEPDWVIIDTKGTNEGRAYAALALADLVLVPSGPVSDEVRAIEMTLRNYQAALSMTQDDADPREHLRVLYQKPAQFPNADMIAYQGLIWDHYGAIDGLPSMSAIKSFVGWQATTTELIQDARTEGRATSSLEKMQSHFDQLATTIQGELDAA